MTHLLLCPSPPIPMCAPPPEHNLVASTHSQLKRIMLIWVSNMAPMIWPYLVMQAGLKRPASDAARLAASSLPPGSEASTSLSAKDMPLRTLPSPAMELSSMLPVRLIVARESLLSSVHSVNLTAASEARANALPPIAAFSCDCVRNRLGAPPPAAAAAFAARR